MASWAPCPEPVGTFDPVLIAEYEGGTSTGRFFMFPPNQLEMMGQSWLSPSDPTEIVSSEMRIQRQGNPTGEIFTEIYAHTGVFGTSSIPTGPALAVSDSTFDMLGLSTVAQWIQFAFSGWIPAALTHYVLVLRNTDGSFLDTSNRVTVTVGSLPGADGNASQRSYAAGIWVADPNEDLHFRIHQAAPGAPPVKGPLTLTSCPDPDPQAFVQCAGPGSGGGFDTVEKFPTYRTSEVARLVTRVSVTKVDRGRDIPVREYIVSREVAERAIHYLNEEDALLLDRITVTKITRVQAFSAEEDALLLDRITVDKTSKDREILMREYMLASEGATLRREILVTESALLLDRITVLKVDRNRDIPMREFMRATEASALKKSITVSEAALLLDRITVDKTNRSRDIDVREFMAASEEANLFRPAGEAAEDALLLDRISVDKVSRTTIISIREFMVASEDASVQKNFIPPVITSCEINDPLDIDDPNELVRCRFNTGIYAESAIVERNVDGAGYTFHQNMNTSPSSGPFISNYYNGSTGEQVRFRIRPFTADGQSGTEGTACVTGIIVIGGGGPGP